MHAQVVDDKTIWLCAYEEKVLLTPHVQITAGRFVAQRVKHHIVVTHLCGSSQG